MDDKKKMIILVIIALVLATTAIVLSVMGSNEISTSRSNSESQPSGGIVGIDIQQSPVEDKLLKNKTQQQ